MINPRDAAAVLDRDFLEVRSRILDLAAALDRHERAPNPVAGPPDHRLSQLRQALQALLDPEPNRAETIQLIFSLEYDPHWPANHARPSADTESGSQQVVARRDEARQKKDG